ncbi:MAG: 3-isopropylmalate dehydrogenase [Syntrophorhabdaceae bacterium]|nr:3-isopropylmalate dehydrogenase [Syntrophorhabdaceae bacterium]MDD5243328.1 3-isopropylmalate dehydrogenase [Syntrophorhabdaceae bacterium]
MKLSIAVLPGDGVGPEIVAEGVKVLGAIGERFGHDFTFREGQMGAAAFERTGIALSRETVELCKSCDSILFGAVGDPKFEQPNLKLRPELGYGLIRLRKELGLFANIRPVRLFPSLINSTNFKPEVVNGVDFIIIRELTGGIYFAEPKQVFRDSGARRAVDTCAYSEEEIRRILTVGFELARGRRKKLTSVDKFQILRTSDLWREIAKEVAAEYPDVEVEYGLVDSTAMRLILSPRDFDVVVTENLFGDILSDEASMLAGSLGMMPSASIAEIPGSGKRLFGLYEPIHGSAPTLKGLNVANPIAIILSVALMLRYSFGLHQEAKSIEDSVDQVLREGYRTEDIMSPGNTKVGTKEMGELIVTKVLA